jgi:hypothetical protein
LSSDDISNDSTFYTFLLILPEIAEAADPSLIGSKTFCFSPPEREGMESNGTRVKQVPTRTQERFEPSQIWNWIAQEVAYLSQARKTVAVRHSPSRLPGYTLR